MVSESVQVVARRVSAFSRALDGLIMALEDSGKPRIEIAIGNEDDNLSRSAERVSA